MPVKPPVATMTAFLRLDIERRALVVHRNADDASGRRRLAIDCRHLVLEQDLHAGLFGRSFERTHQAVPRRQHSLHHRIGRLTSLHHRPIHHRAVHFPRHRIADRRAAEIVRRLVDEDDPMGDEPFESRRAVVGEGADDLAVVVAIVGKAVRLDHRPVGQIPEQQIRRVVDAVFLLHAGAAAERNVAAAGNGMAADILLGFDEDDRRARLARNNGRRQTSGA